MIFFEDDIDGIVFDFNNGDHEDLTSKKWRILVEYFWKNMQNRNFRKMDFFRKIIIDDLMSH